VTDYIRRASESGSQLGIRPSSTARECWDSEQSCVGPTLWFASAKDCRLIYRRENDNMNERYVLSNRIAGLGDRLICLAAAWLYARDTGRSLVVDWRFSCGRIEDSANAFPLCFCPASKLSGDSFLCEHRDSIPSKTSFPRTVEPGCICQGATFATSAEHVCRQGLGGPSDKRKTRCDCADCRIRYVC
jgi:hypothetical protein